jgi:hypothetical protein
MSNEPDCAAGIVVYTGTRVVHIADHIAAVPWTML